MAFAFSKKIALILSRFNLAAFTVRRSVWLCYLKSSVRCNPSGNYNPSVRIPSTPAANIHINVCCTFKPAPTAENILGRLTGQTDNFVAHCV